MMESTHEGSNLVPRVGMQSATIEEIKDFYGKYACSQGFGWKIRTTKKRLDGQPYYFILACSREGNAKSRNPASVKTLPVMKINYKVKMNASKGLDGLWYITSVDLDHCHQLSRTKGRMFNKNRKLSMHVKRTLEMNYAVGVRINKTFRSLVEDAGCYENLSFVERDLRNHISKEKRIIGKKGDAKALVEYFCRMKDQNVNFWYDIDLDEEFHIRNVFWADARSRVAYEAFGDVVSFA